MGDTQPAEMLQSHQNEAQSQALKCEEECQRLRVQSNAGRRHLGELERSLERLKTQIEHAQNLVNEAENAARSYAADADAIGQALGSEWAAVLADRRRYDEERQAVDKAQPVDEKAGDLCEASGQIKQLDFALAELSTALGNVPEAHRLPIPEAQEQETATNQAAQAESIRAGGLRQQIADLASRQKDAEEYGIASQAADEETKDWDALAGLLKPGGLVQVWITNREQQQIAQEVNQVLQQLDDSLRVQLSDPIRRNAADIQEVVVVDLTDPLQEGKHFALLSGGEQFRVALALAWHCTGGRPEARQVPCWWMKALVRWIATGATRWLSKWPILAGAF